jgi:hypothetical protein
MLGAAVRTGLLCLVGTEAARAMDEGSVFVLRC